MVTIEIGTLRISAFGNIAFGYDKETGEEGVLLRVQVAEEVVKGNVLSVSPNADNKYIKQTNEYDSVCIAAQAGSQDEYIWAWTTGSICQVLFKDSVSSVRGYVAIAADTDGRADCVDMATISGNPAITTHFKEIGHVKESVEGAENNLILIHFHTL